MPPARPSALAGSMPWPQGAARPLAAVPPLPPARPIMQPTAVASLAAAAGLSAAAPEPAPATPVPTKTAERVPAGPGEERALVRLLFSAKADPRPPASPAPAAAAPSLVPTGGPTLALGFSSRPAGDLTAGRFSGPAVKALPVLR
jgi:hypothetical protein